MKKAMYVWPNDTEVILYQELFSYKIATKPSPH